MSLISHFFTLTTDNLREFGVAETKGLKHKNPEFNLGDNKSITII